MVKDIFDYNDYRAYLLAFIGSQPKSGRGIRAQMAEALSSPLSHISQVLKGVSDLSLEQAERMNTYLGHTDEEAQFFLLLVQIARSGTVQLKKRLKTQVEQIISKRLILKDRLRVKSLVSREDEAQFYSLWLYGAVHVLLTIPGMNSKEAIAQRLNLTVKRAGELLEFLVSIGLVRRDSGGGFEVGDVRLHLGSDSPMITQFHTNWRMQAVRSLSEDREDDLHYSSAVTLSKSDVIKIKSMLIKHIAEIKAVIKESPAEELLCFSLDFFRL